MKNIQPCASLALLAGLDHKLTEEILFLVSLWPETRQAYTQEQVRVYFLIRSSFPIILEDYNNCLSDLLKLCDRAMGLSL
jgi:hypothetical protein